MVMLCVTISSFAGVKKCYKKTLLSGYGLFPVPEDTGGHSREKEQPSSHQEYCASAYPIIDNQQEEERVKWLPGVDHTTGVFLFYEQDYSNPPFAPPRKPLRHS